MSDGAKRKKASSGFHLIAGLGSGAASAFLLQPADLLKTRVQQAQAATLGQALRHILNGPHPVRSLYRGVTPSVLRTGCGSALYFGLLDQMRQYAATLPSLNSKQPTSQQRTLSSLPKLGHVANLTTGALARVAAGLIVNPITVLKVRYESTHYAYQSLSRAARDIATKEGLRGFFAGFGATAVRDAPYAGLYVLVYEQAKATLGPVMATKSSTTEISTPTSAAVNFSSGVIAAITATTATNPFDAIKTRLQLAPKMYRNMFRAAGIMLQQEGVRSMFRGLSMRIGRKAISSAFTWTVYEELIRRAEKVVI